MNSNLEIELSYKHIVTDRHFNIERQFEMLKRGMIQETIDMILGNLKCKCKCQNSFSYFQ